VQFADWGDLQMRSAACAERRLDSIAWTTARAGFESGDVDVSRLTKPKHLDDGVRCD
jgi:hypothetical protein